MDLSIDFRPFIDQDGVVKSSADRTAMMSEFPDLESPAVIAVMGLPYTGMESICRMILEWAGGPVYDTKGALDSLSREQGPPANEDEAARLHRVSFDVVCQMAGYMYPWLDYYGRARCLVISSTCFDYKRQLDRLVAISACHDDMDYKPRGPLLIVECRRRNRFQWQRRVERDFFSKQLVVSWTGPMKPKKWYEPTCWMDVETAATRELQGSNDDYFLTLARSHPRLRKLLVDPFEDISDNISTPVRGVPGYSLLLSEAIKHLLTCNVSPSHVVVEYATWRRQYLENLSPDSRVTTRHYLCRPGDCIFRFTNNLQQDGAVCYICDQQVVKSERGYYCKFCSLSFHEACTAEIITPPPYSRAIDSYLKQTADIFPETYTCYSCQDFSEECEPCIFRTFIKCRILPIVMSHVGDDHTLSFRYYHTLPSNLMIQTSFLGNHYNCKACGHPGFMTSYCCNICKSQFHLHCLELPLQTKSVGTQHGGHEHDIKIEFSCVKEEEYEWCLVCCDDIDPQTWVYTCQECEFVAHVYCLFPHIRHCWTHTYGDMYTEMMDYKH